MLPSRASFAAREILRYYLGFSPWVPLVWILRYPVLPLGLDIFGLHWDLVCHMYWVMAGIFWKQELTNGRQVTFVVKGLNHGMI